MRRGIRRTFWSDLVADGKWRKRADFQVDGKQDGQKDMLKNFTKELCRKFKVGVSTLEGGPIGRRVWLGWLLSANVPFAIFPSAQAEAGRRWNSQNQSQSNPAIPSDGHPVQVPWVSHHDNTLRAWDKSKIIVRTCTSISFAFRARNLPIASKSCDKYLTLSFTTAMRLRSWAWSTRPKSATHLLKTVHTG